MAYIYVCIITYHTQTYTYIRVHKAPHVFADRHGTGSRFHVLALISIRHTGFYVEELSLLEKDRRPKQRIPGRPFCRSRPPNSGQGFATFQGWLLKHVCRCIVDVRCTIDLIRPGSTTSAPSEAPTCAPPQPPPIASAESQALHIPSAALYHRCHSRFRQQQRLCTFAIAVFPPCVGLPWLGLTYALDVQKCTASLFGCAHALYYAYLSFRGMCNFSKRTNLGARINAECMCVCVC